MKVYLTFRGWCEPNSSDEAFEDSGNEFLEVFASADAAQKHIENAAKAAMDTEGYELNDDPLDSNDSTTIELVRDEYYYLSFYYIEKEVKE